MKEIIKILEDLVKNPAQLTALSDDDRIALIKVSGQLSRPSRDEIRSRRKEKQIQQRQKQKGIDRNIRAQTGIRQARQAPVFIAPKQIDPTYGDLSKALLNKALPNEALPNVEAPLSSSPPSTEPKFYSSPRKCYTCNAEFKEIHFFYDALCVPCGDLNYQKRFQVASLHGKTVLITGSRLKIGYQASLLLLRAGARVIATTRFPVDSALRFSKEEDFPLWKDRLEIYGLDLRHTPSVEIFCHYLLHKLDRLDIIIHNAAQTVRRPPAFYAHLMDSELLSYDKLPNAIQPLLSSFQQCKNYLNQKEDLPLTSPPSSNSLNTFSAITTMSSPLESSLQLNLQSNTTISSMGILSSALLSQVPYTNEKNESLEKLFPKNQLDVDLQQVDLRETNSWRYKIDDVPTAELMEVQLVNAIAPFVITSKLLPLMKKDYTGEKYIVNVTAMEGKFYRFKKSERHPHTNMAKAALNMLTHTAAADLAKQGIYMNAVDTGWVTDENPADQVEKVKDIHDFQPPIDIVDGAARVCDPIFLGISTGHHWYGKFLKDYKPIDW